MPPKDLTELGKRLKKGTNRFFFELYLEYFEDDIADSLRQYLKGITPDGLRKMIRKKQFPPLSPSIASTASDYLEYIEKLSDTRLMEILAAARPDLAQLIESMGMTGARYIVLLRQHYLSLIRNPEVAMAAAKDYLGKPSDTVKAVCDTCGKSWPVLREDFQEIEKCPFCGYLQGEPSPTEEDSPED